MIGVSEHLDPGQNENVTVALFDGVPGATFDRPELTEEETRLSPSKRRTAGPRLTVTAARTPRTDRQP